MRIYSDTLTTTDIAHALVMARSYGQDIFAAEFSQSRGRKRAHTLTVYCESEHGRYATNRQRSPGARAATWDAWGYFIAELLNRDPEAVIGIYDGAEGFRAQCQAEAERVRKYHVDDIYARTHTGDFLNTLETA